jgi:hypothetical protein
MKPSRRSFLLGSVAAAVAPALPALPAPRVPLAQVGELGPELMMQGYSALERSRLYAKGVLNGWLTLDEVRKAEDLPVFVGVDLAQGESWSGYLEIGPDGYREITDPAEIAKLWPITRVFP